MLESEDMAMIETYQYFLTRLKHNLGDNAKTLEGINYSSLEKLFYAWYLNCKRVEKEPLDDFITNVSQLILAEIQYNLTEVEIKIKWLTK